MKKFLFLTLILGALTTTAVQAQGNADPASILQQMKERLKSPMMEKTGLSDTQVDKIIEINFEIRQQAGSLRDLSEADRSKKIAELKATKEKRYSDIPLTPEQIKSVHAFFEDMAKKAPPKH